MLAIEVSNETKMRLSEMDILVKRKLPILEKNLSIGERLVEAFGTDDKAVIAETLGFASVQGVYKILNGTRELDFEKLKKFQNYTKCSIDWLLTGKGRMILSESDTSVGIPAKLQTKLKTIAREQEQIVFADVDIAGDNLGERTLNLLVEYLIHRALVSANLIERDELMPKADRKRAERFSFAANVPQSLDERVEEIIERKMSGKNVSQVAQDEEFRAMIRDIVREETKQARLRPVHTVDFGNADEGTERTRKAG